MPSMSKGILKAPCMRICHSFSGPGGFKNPHTFNWHASWSPQRVGPGGIGKHVLAKASSIILMGQGSLPDWRRHAAPLKSPTTMSTCPCTSQYDCKQHILSNATLVSEVVVDAERHHGKEDLPLRGTLRNEAREMTACSTHPDCPSFTA